MICFTIKLANRTIQANVRYETTQHFCAEYCTQGTPDFSVTVTDEDIALERRRSEKECVLEGGQSQNFSDAVLEVTALQRKITEQLFDYNVLVFHGSTIAVDGRAYLFTAKSGTGKSTHTHLWRKLFKEHARMVNDDKPFLEIADKEVVAHGSPWRGKHMLGERIAVPLKAICILKRGNENRIQRITPKEALHSLIEQTNRPMNSEKYPKYLDMIDQICGKVEFYSLSCNMDPEAALVSYKAMSGEEKE